MKTLAVHLHIFYIDQVHEILHKLQNLSSIDYDLYVTMVQENPAVQKQIMDFNPQAKIWITENRGYDIGPFIDFLHKIDLDNYKYVMKLHTKGTKSKNYTHLNGYRFDNELWGKVMWDSLLGSDKVLTNNLKKLRHNHIGMLGSQYCLTAEKQNHTKLLPQINKELQRMNMNKIQNLSFVAGSMFMSKAALLKPLLCYALDDFAITDGKIKEGTLAHVMERLFGAVILQQGYQIIGVRGKMKMTVKISAHWLSFIRFFFQKKVTKSGKLIIKICKIPVYHKPAKEV